MCQLLLLSFSLSTIIGINFFINVFIVVINLFLIQLFAIIGSDGRPFRASGREHMLASRTGTRLSSVRHGKLCSQSNLSAQIQLWWHMNGQCTCYYLVNFPIIAIIVPFWVAACLNLRPSESVQTTEQWLWGTMLTMGMQELTMVIP